MSKNFRQNWFKVKLLCRNITLEDVAKELYVEKEELILLMRGDKTDKNFTKWVIDNLGKPYWL